MAIEETDYAWAAGIIDGEGTLRLEKQAKKNGKVAFYPKIAVPNTDPLMLCKLKLLLGGRCYQIRVTASHFGKKPIWVWIAASKTAIEALDKVFPYLVTKRRQAEVLIGFRALRRSRGGKQNAYGLDDAAVRLKNADLLAQQEQMFWDLKKLKRTQQGEFVQ